jgi:hypothetical protein
MCLYGEECLDILPQERWAWLIIFFFKPPKPTETQGIGFSPFSSANKHQNQVLPVCIDAPTRHQLTKNPHQDINQRHQHSLLMTVLIIILYGLMCRGDRVMGVSMC